MPVREGVVNHLRSLELPWQIGDFIDPAISFGDLLMEVQVEGFVSWQEQVKVYLGALIYAFHHAYLTGDTACWEMAANLTPPSKIASEEMPSTEAGHPRPPAEKASAREKKRVRKGLPLIED